MFPVRLVGTVKIVQPSLGRGLYKVTVLSLGLFNPCVTQSAVRINRVSQEE